MTSCEPITISPSVPRPSHDVMLHLLECAVRAPSLYNSQPWQFTLGAGYIDMFLDSARAMRALDPGYRQLYISCGAALFNLRVAAKRRGFCANVKLLPDFDQPHWLARIELEPTQRFAPEEHDMYQAIFTRRTQRAPFASGPLPMALLPKLEDAVAEEGAWMVRIEHYQLSEAASLVAAGDQSQLQHEATRNEIASRIGSEGIPIDRSGLGWRRWLKRPWLSKWTAQGIAAHDEKLARNAPWLLAIGSTCDTAAQHLQTGMALERLLLLLELNDLRVSYLNQAVEWTALRPALESLVRRSGGYGMMQLLLRVGHAPRESKAVPRRSLVDVLR